MGEEAQQNLIRINANMVKLVIGILAFVGGVGSGLWAAAQWKTSVDDHLQRIEDHLKNEDDHIKEEREQLQWLVQHNKDAGQAPMGWLHPGPESLTVPLLASGTQVSESGKSY
jgi:hypothetical protein